MSSSTSRRDQVSTARGTASSTSHTPLQGRYQASEHDRVMDLDTTPLYQINHKHLQDTKLQKVQCVYDVPNQLRKHVHMRSGVRAPSICDARRRALDAMHMPCVLLQVDTSLDGLSSVQYAVVRDEQVSAAYRHVVVQLTFPGMPIDLDGNTAPLPDLDAVKAKYAAMVVVAPD